MADIIAKEVSTYELKFLRAELIEADPKRPGSKEKFKLFFACATYMNFRGSGGVKISIEQMADSGGNWSIKVDESKFRKLKGILEKDKYYLVVATSSAMNGDNGRNPIIWHDEIISVEPLPSPVHA